MAYGTGSFHSHEAKDTGVPSQVGLFCSVLSGMFRTRSTGVCVYAKPTQLQIFLIQCERGLNATNHFHVNFWFLGACSAWRSNNADQETCNVLAANFDLYASDTPRS